MTVDEAAAHEATHRHEADLQRSLHTLLGVIDAAIQVIEQDAGWIVSERGYRYRVVTEL